MLNRILSTLTVIALAVFGLAPAAANATSVTGDTGDIYYWGAWDYDAGQYLGMRKYNLDTGIDQRLGTDSSSCAPLIGSPRGLAVDPSHNRLYWAIDDGNTGIFAMDLSSGECYTVISDNGITGVEIVPSTQTLVWAYRDGSRGIARTNVSDLTNIPTATTTPLAIAGATDPQVTDIVFNGTKLYYLVSDSTISIHSSPSNNPGATWTLEKATTLTNGSSQLGVTATHFYFTIDFDQVMRAQRTGTEVTEFLNVDSVSGFALTATNLYSIKDRDTSLKSTPLSATTQVMTVLPGNPLPDMSAYLRYTTTPQAGLGTPNITASNTNSTNGEASVPFSGITITGSKKMYFDVIPTDASAPVRGVCTITASKCVITGLDDSKDYTVQLAAAYTYESGGNTVRTIASLASNIATINQAPVVAPSPTQTFRGFDFERARLTAETKAEIQAFVTANPNARKVYCTGYTGYNWHKRSAIALRHLAVNRAQNVCNYIHRLNPAIKIKLVKPVNETSKRSATRRVFVKLAN